MTRNPDVNHLLREDGEWYLPLVLHILKRSYPERTFPVEMEERAKRIRIQNTVRKLLYFKELKKILAAFNEAGIAAIPLKGVVMDGFYPAGLRPFRDMDILVHREELSRVLGILQDLGYQHHGVLLRPGAEEFQGALAYVKPGNPTVVIEPHWSLGPPCPYPGRLDMDGVWNRAVKARIAGCDSLVLCPEDMLLHACFHIVQHCQGGWLASACDISELIHHYGKALDWRNFSDRVLESRLSLPVLYSLEKAIGLFQPPVPSAVLERLRAFRPGRFEQWIFALLTTPGDRDISGTSIFLARLITTGGLMPKLRYVQNMLFPGWDFMVNRYPELRSRPVIFYYLFRLKDIGRKGIKALTSLGFHRD